MENINEIEKEVLEIISKEDAEEFEKIAKGRKFCKIGERIVDICDDEIKKYNIEKSNNIFVKILKKRKIKSDKEKLKIENRTSSAIRAVIFKCLRQSETYEINKQEIINKVKNIILDKVEKYKEV